MFPLQTAQAVIYKMDKYRLYSGMLIHVHLQITEKASTHF